jgi:Na+-translocating ferredoxin:NAD+ oxidoreductase RNF subunit RnfB
LKNCPVDAISGERKKVHTLDQDLCIKCGACLDVCPPKISAVSKVTGRKLARILKNSSGKRVAK